MTVLALNSGSSSIKAAVYELNGQLIKRFHLSGLPDKPVLDGKPFELTSDLEPMDALLDTLARDPACASLQAIGHRIVHGGKDLTEPVILNADTLSKLEALTPLAPQHQPANLAGVTACKREWPEAMQVGVFDTAFHRTQPRVATLFGLPLEYEARGIIRYGFHGLSYQYITQTLAQQALLPERVIIAHLGSGCSMAAILNGRSIATTMGFTALDGLPMGTRCGSIDPGLILHFLTEEGMEPAALHDLLYKNSGLKGLSEISGDMRDITASKTSQAKLARDYFVYHCLKEIGALTAVLGGCNMLVLTGGIGENDADLQRSIEAKITCLGITDVQRLKTDEEAVIAEACLRLLGAEKP